MEKIKTIWSDWRGSIGFVGGVLVVSTSFFTCSFDPNEEAIKEEVVEAIAPEKAEAKEEAEQSEEAEKAPEVVGPEGVSEAK